MIGAQAVAKETPDDGTLPQATNVSLGEPGLSFRYVETFGVTEQAYIADTQHLNHPNGVFIDDSDNLYVVEEHGARMLKYRTSDSANLLSIGTAGLQNRGEYTFDHPLDVAVDGSANIWVVDRHRVAQYDASGDFLQEFPPGDPWNRGDDNSHFDTPRGIAFDGDGRLYVSDYGNHRIQVYSVTVDSSLVYSTTIGETGVSGSDSTHFNGPSQIAFDSSDRFYVADVDNARVQRCTHSSGWTCSTFHGTGAMGSDPDQLQWAHGIGVDDSDRVYITDNFNARVKRCQPDGSCSIFASGGDLEWPTSVAFDSSGNVYVSDFYDHTILKFQSNGSYVGNFAGTHDQPYQTDGAHFNGPSGVAADADGNIYVSTIYGFRLFKLTPSGTTAWAIGTPGIYGDDNAHFGSWQDGPHSVAVDPGGAVYVADTGNHRIQKCTSSGTCSTFAGHTGESGNQDDRFTGPHGVAVDGNGNVYVGDTWNERVKKCTPDGVCSTFAGEADVAGDDNSHFDDPMGVAVDTSGNVYVADCTNHRVQKCTPGGSCSTFAGIAGESGDGFDHFNRPHDVAVDAQGRVYVADTNNQRVQVFDSTGAYLTTIGGEWGSGRGQLRHAAGVAVDAYGNVYVADELNARVQKYAPGVPGWRQANISGFGSSNNWGAWSLGTFGDALYASTGNFASGAEVHRLSSGSWEQVVSGGFGDSSNVAVDWFAEFNGDLYAGTWNDGNGGQIWRSATGNSGSWSRVVNGGFGDTDNSEVMTLSPFDGYLYAGTWSTTIHGAEIWRSSTGDSGSWSQVVGEAVFGDSDNVAIMSFEVFGDRLYAATYNETTGGEVWRTDNGTTWNQVNADGFGNANNIRVISLETFGGQLYAGTWNSTDGGAIWRTANGMDWEWVVNDGFGDVNNIDIASLVAFDGDL